jgi:two-component system, OmpR family, alkaline phosphatase synthesis response regulator PhoP
MNERADRKTVLVVDDESNIRMALQFLMEEQGYAVRCAADGEEAVEEIKKSPPDVVLLDVKMPKRSGYEVCQAVRSDPNLDQVRILVLSALCQHVAIEKATAMGADGYLTKPFSTADVVEKVRSLAARSQEHHA